MNATTQRTRVVVTGLGATTPIGGDVPSTWAALLAGTSGVGVLTEEWAAELPVRIAARAEVEPLDVLDRVEARTLDRSQQFAIIAAREAWAQAGKPDVEKERLGVVFASGIGGVTTLLEPVRRAAREGSAPGVSAHCADADAERPGGRGRTRPASSGRRPHAGQRLRVGRRGHRVRPRDDPHRARRRRGLRWHRGGDSPAATRRVRRDARDVDPQRRAAARVSPLRQGSRRLHHGRGCRRRRARVGRAREGARRDDPRRDRRCGHHVRRLPHRRARPRGSRRCQGTAGRSRIGQPGAVRCHAHQRARDLDTGRRRRRSEGHS